MGSGREQQALSSWHEYHWVGRRPSASRFYPGQVKCPSLGFLIQQVGQNDPLGLFQPWTSLSGCCHQGSPQRRDGWFCHQHSLLIWFNTNKITYFITACERKVVEESISIIIWFSPINGYQAHFHPPTPHSLFLPHKLELGRSPCPYCLCSSSSRAPVCSVSSAP